MSGRIFTSFRVGGFTILPEGEPPPVDGTIPLVLGRKGAFGSGEHETTAACLELLERLPVAGMRVLDLGSGTGILAIATVRLGAGQAVAIDIDGPAARCCADNVRYNEVGDRVVTVQGELAAVRGEFDLVLANIYADILLALAEQLVTMTRPGGHLLLSGIPLQDKFDVWRRYTGLGCSQRDSRVGEEYATYLLQRLPP